MFSQLKNINISNAILILMARGGNSGSGDQTFNFSEHDHVAYQVEGDDE